MNNDYYGPEWGVEDDLTLVFMVIVIATILVSLLGAFKVVDINYAIAGAAATLTMLVYMRAVHWWLQR